MAHSILDILKMTDEQVFDYIIESLFDKDYKIFTDQEEDNYILAIPTDAEGVVVEPNKICLVAHIDTCMRTRKNQKIIQKGHIIKNKSGILGADDRAGVYAILELLELEQEKRPIVVFTNYEESGGLGVNRLLEDKGLDDVIEKINLFVELDRKGANEYVFYTNILPKDIKTWVEKHGWKEHYGSYSDVSDITEELKIPHVNLSVGYYSQHTSGEYLNMKVLKENITLYNELLNDSEGLPRIIMTKEQITAYQWKSGYSGNWREKYKASSFDYESQDQWDTDAPFGSDEWWEYYYEYNKNIPYPGPKSRGFENREFEEEDPSYNDCQMELWEEKLAFQSDHFEVHWLMLMKTVNYFRTVDRLLWFRECKVLFKQESKPEVKPVIKKEE